MHATLLRSEAYDLLCVLFEAMLASPDPARLARLRHVHWRAERRYWRRRDQDEPPGNGTPAWFYRRSTPGY